MHEAKTQLFALVRSLREGREHEIIICIGGHAAAKLVPVGAAPARQLGIDHGLIKLAPDFDALDDKITALFEG